MEYFIGTGRLLTQGAAFQRTAPCFMCGRDCKIDGNCRNLTLPVSRASICVSDGRRTAQHKPLLVRYDGITPLIGGEHHERNAHHHPNRADRGRPHPHTQIGHVSGGDAGRPGELRRQDYRSGFCRQRSSPRPYDERPENQRPDRDAGKQHHHPHRPHGCTGRLAVTADESRNIYGGRSF